MLLRFDNVSKQYESQGAALESVSFSIESGEFTALAGPSGSGKTTILNLAAGLDTASQGQVQLLSHDLSRLTPRELASLRRDSIGFVFQSYNLFPVLTALENVEFPLTLRRIAPAERRSRAKAVLEEVGLGGLGHRFPRELSGGQQQRVAIARAIAGRPRLVLADEPTANLDSRTATALLTLFSDLNARRGITFLFSSHDPLVLREARRTLHVSDGKITTDTQKTK